MWFAKKPEPVEAHRWTGDDVSYRTLERWGATVRRAADGGLELLAGVDGAQGWATVPVGHWVFGLPRNNDWWPVADEYVTDRYVALGLGL